MRKVALSPPTYIEGITSIARTLRDEPGAPKCSPSGPAGLLRLRKPDGSVIGPAAFSLAFDEPILSRRIGYHVLERAVAQATAWEAAGVDFGHIAINVSSSQFVELPGSPCLVDEILGATRSSGLLPRRIQIEVTEGRRMVAISARSLRRCVRPALSLLLTISVPDLLPSCT